MAADSEISIHVKHGSAEIELTGLAPATTIGQLKEQLESTSGVFARHQKLIFKGKVLEDKATLAGSRIGPGAKLMLLVSAASGQAPKTAGAAAAAAAAEARPNAAAALAALRAGGGAAAAAAAARGGGASSSGSGAGQPQLRPASLSERRQTWSKMGVVALRDLGLGAVPEECFEGLPDVKGADLSQNRLTAVPAAISRLSSLATLRLSDNSLTDAGVPWAALAGLSGLTALSLDRNRLTTLPDALGAVSGLVRLGAAGNAITAVGPSALGPALQEVDLSDNALEALPETIGAATSLVDLSASSNRLAAIPSGITALGRLRSLRLDDNRIKALPDNLFMSCSSLAALLLRSNPITVEALRSAPGFAGYEARRRAKTDKQLGGRVMGDVDAAFCEGADVEQWQRWAGPGGRP